MIPPRIREGIHQYAETGLPQGRFLDSCLANDLKTAVCAADKESLAAICEIVFYIDDFVPFEIRGSDEKVCAWRSICRERRKRQAV